MRLLIFFPFLLTASPDYNKISLPFEPNHGQAPAEVRFVARAPGYTLQILETGAVMLLSQGHQVRLQLLGAQPARAAQPLDPLPGTSSYFEGPDTSKWLCGVPHYGKVQLSSVYQGVDLIYYGTGGRIEYDFVVAPGSDPSRIRIGFDGITALRMSRGDLVIETPAGRLLQHAPVAWQERHGQRIKVPVRFALKENAFSFTLGTYDRSLPLVIDPAIAWSVVGPRTQAAFPGSVTGVAVDAAGAVYVAGNQYNPSLQSVVYKINSAGTAYDYITILNYSEASAIAVDAQGAAYVGGRAGAGFPAKNSLKSPPPGNQTYDDGFIAKISTAGTDLVYASFLGGSGIDTVSSVAVDNAGSAHVSGTTTSRDLPTFNPIRAAYVERQAGFLLKLTPDGSNFVYSTYVGSAYAVQHYGLAIDRQGKAIVTGYLQSGNTADTQTLPLLNPVLSTNTGTFLLRFTPTGTLNLGTFLPFGSANSVAIDSLNHVYLVGGGTAPGVWRLNADASSLVFLKAIQGLITSYWSAYSRATIASPPVVAIGANDMLCITGIATNALPQVRPMVSPGDEPALFLMKMTTSGSIVYSTFLSTTAVSNTRLAVDASGAAIVGGTSAGNVSGAAVPLTNPGSVPSPTSAGATTGFVAKIVDAPDTSLPTVTVTVNFTTPLTATGLQVLVDGVLYSNEVTLRWVKGTAHTLIVSRTQGNALRYTFQGWSDGGSPEHTVIPMANTTYTAAFSVAAPLRLNVAPAGGGTVIVQPPLQNGVVPLYTNVTLTATAAAGFSFTGWGGALSGSANPVTVQFTYNPAPNGDPTIVLNANFSAGSLGFLPITPCRVLDTRLINDGILRAAVPRDVAILQSRCGIPSTAKALALNVTVVPARPLAYLTVYPSGQPRPLVSTLNAFEGQIVANAAIVPAGSNGAITLFATDDTHIVLDVNGYFTEASYSLNYHSLSPCRIVDTRSGPPMSGGSTRTFSVAGGNCPVPMDAGAYVLNFTVVPREPLAYMSAWPAGLLQPLVSTLNSPRGRVLANAAIIPAGVGDAINVYVANTTDVIVDINGYFAPPGSPGSSRFFTVSPCRVLDTRTSYGPGSGVGYFPVSNGSCGAPDSATAYSLNVTAVPRGYLGYLTLFQPFTDPPLASTLNAWEGQVVANAAIVPGAPSGLPGVPNEVAVFTSDLTDIVLDINGYFAPVR